MKRSSPAPASRPLYEVAWSLPLKGGSHTHAIVIGEHVIVGDGLEGVAAYATASGQRLWKYPELGRLVGGLADVVVIHLDRSESHVVDVATGRPRLSLQGDVEGLALSERGLAATERFIVHGHSREFARGALRAFDHESGRRLWTHWSHGYEGASLSGRRIVANRWQGGVVALDATDGSVSWTCECRSSRPSLVDARRAYVHTGGDTEALDLETGASLWKVARVLDWALNDEVYALSDDRTRVEAWDAATGQRKRAADLELRRFASLRRHDPAWILCMSRSQVFLTGVADPRTGRSSPLMVLDRARGSMWGHVTSDGGATYAPMLTPSGLCYRTSERLYGLRRTAPSPSD